MTTGLENGITDLKSDIDGVEMVGGRCNVWGG